MTLNVNLFAGPGVGKSTMAASLFVALKMRGVHAELVTEYAKELVYQNLIAGASQRDIITEQHRRQDMLQGKVQVAVTDAPVPLSLVYAPEHERPELCARVQGLVGSWNTLNVLLHRDLATGYETQGRYQTQEEATRFHHEHIVPFVKDFYGSRDNLVECHVDDALDVLLPCIQSYLESKSAITRGGVTQPTGSTPQTRLSTVESTD